MTGAAQPRREIAPDRTSKLNEILDLTFVTLLLLHRLEEVGGLVRQSPGMGTRCDQMPAPPHRSGCVGYCASQQEAASLKGRSFTAFETEVIKRSELENELEADQLHNIKKIPNNKEQRAKETRKITKYIYCGLDREKRKASRD